MYLFVFVHSKNLILVISQTKALHHKGLLFPWSRYHIGVVHMHIRVKVLLVCCYVASSCYANHINIGLIP